MLADAHDHDGRGGNAMTTESYITDEMRAAIGVESEPWTVEVDKTSVRMFARAVGYTDPIFYDEDFARSKGYRSLPAPPHYLGTPVFNPATSDATFGGGARRRFNTPFKRGLNGGTDIEYFDTIVAGDVLTATSKISDIVQRQGSIGTMLITTTETTYRRDGKVVAIMRGTGISY
jgi:hydroxyacyl-ACP dehydratase HTD2-like protein with hotdog domain